MARQYKKIESQEEHVFEIFDTSEAGATRLGEVDLLYLNQQLTCMKICLLFGNNPEIHIKNKNELKNLKIIAQEIENIFSITGLTPFTDKTQ